MRRLIAGEIQSRGFRDTRLSRWEPGVFIMPKLIQICRLLIVLPLVLAAVIIVVPLYYIYVLALGILWALGFDG